MSEAGVRVPRAPSFDLRFEKSPVVVKRAQTVGGRLALLFVAAVLLRPFSELWPIVVLTSAAISFADLRQRNAIAASGTIAAFVLAPNWYGVAAPAAFAEGAGLTDWASPALRWGAPGLALGFAALFLAAVRAGRPAFLARRPFLSLLVVFAAVLAAATQATFGVGAQLWLWSLAAALSGYIWFIALVAIEQRGPTNRVPFWQMFIVLHPFWGSTGAPYMLAPRRLAKVAAGNPEELAISQIKAVKLLAWAFVLLNLSHAWRTLVHERLGVPEVHEALAAYLGPGLPWRLRWLSLISDFFEAVLHIATMGHAIIGGARLAGYNLLRNTYRPFQSRSVAEFWARYYYYFKEMLLALFYFPAYLGYFRGYPRLRAAFATFMAAGFGNALFHFIRELDRVVVLGFWRALIGYQTYAFYCLLLAGGITASQLWPKSRLPAAPTRARQAMAFASVMGFYCLLQVFDDTGRTLSLADHFRFFLGLFMPFE